MPLEQKQNGMAASRTRQDRLPFFLPAWKAVVLRYSMKDIQKAFKRI